MQRLFCILAVVFLLYGGCARLNTRKPANYRTVASSAVSDPEAARVKHEKALELLADCRVDEAEQCLQEALIEDVSFGPAHNTLGKIYYDQKKFYLAAWEFEYATKTMPNRPEPFNNLGLVLESVDQLPLASNMYQQALDLDRENLQYVGNYARNRYRQFGFSEELRPFLEELSLDHRERWREWARLVLSKNHPEFEAMESDYSRPGFEYSPAEYELESLPLQPITETEPGTTEIVAPAELVAPK